MVKVIIWLYIRSSDIELHVYVMFRLAFAFTENLIKTIMKNPKGYLQYDELKSSRKNERFCTHQSRSAFNSSSYVVTTTGIKSDNLMQSKENSIFIRLNVPFRTTLTRTDLQKKNECFDYVSNTDLYHQKKINYILY